MIKKIFLAFKTHFDFGFTDLAEKVLAQYTGQMLADIVAACVDTAGLDKLRFVFTLPAWPLRQMVDGGADREALARLIDEGQVAWHALPFTSHTDFAGIEDLIAGLRYARELSERFGKPPAIAAKMTDVPGHGWILPTILSGAGIRFIHLGCNEYAMPPDVPELFFWEGPDGSRVLTMYCKEGYGSSELMPESWPFPVWLAMMHTHDNNGPQSPEAIRAIVAGARERHPDVEIVSGTLDDFYRELSACDLSGVPVIRADLADTWIHGVGSYPAEVAAVRGARGDVLAAQICLALAGADPCGPEMAAVGRVYDSLMLFDEHTWGLDVKTWMTTERVYEKKDFNAMLDSNEYRYMERSWQEQRERAERARIQAEALLESFSHPEENLLNPGGALYTGWVRVNDKENPAAITVFGRPAIYQEEMAPLTIARPAPVKALMEVPRLRTEGAETVFENHRYAIRFDGDAGIIREVYDKSMGVAILRENNGAGVFSYSYEIYGMEEIEDYLDCYCYIDSDWGVKDNGRMAYSGAGRQTFSPRFQGWSREGCDLLFRHAGAAAEAYGDAGEIALRITLPPAGDEFFVELTLAGKEKTPCVESASLILPLPPGKTEYRLNKNGTLIDPRTDIIRGANHVLYCLEAFAAAQSGKTGVCAVTHDVPLLSIGEPGVYKFRQEYEETLPQLRFNLFNNMWGTNFPQWMGGDFTFRFTVFGTEWEKGLMQKAIGLCHPPRAVKAPPAASPVKLPEAVQVLNCKPCAGGLLLRLRDTSGTSRTLRVAAAEPGQTLQLTDLQEVPFGEKAAGALSVPLGAYGIVSLYIRPDDGRHET